MLSLMRVILLPMIIDADIERRFDTHYLRCHDADAI